MSNREGVPNSLAFPRPTLLTERDHLTGGMPCFLLPELARILVEGRHTEERLSGPEGRGLCGN